MKTIEQIIRDDIGQCGPQLPSDEYEQRIDSVLGQMNCAELLTRISNAVAEIGGGSGMRLVYSGPVSALRSSMKEAPPSTVFYTNYRGETSERTITPIRPWFGSTEWHPEPQWLLRAYDHDKGAERDFALKDFGRQQQSAARELALEEHLHAIEQQLVVNLEYFHDEKRILLETLQSHIISHISAIRTLSSPGHANAGKVEGGGWMPIESAPKDGTVILVYREDAGVFTAHYVEEDAHLSSTMNPPEGDFYWFSTAGDDLTNDMPTHWRHLPLAPASEGTSNV